MFSDFVPSDTDAVRPFVYEDERTVSMHFDISAIQSRMRRGDPYTLELDYTRTMTGFLLFEPQPRSILMIGLGGGSLPKYCHKHLPDTDITVVEINPHVIEMREAFSVPPDDARFRVVCGDGAAFVAQAARKRPRPWGLGRRPRYDVVLVDGFTYDGQPQELCTRSFYDDCRALLSPTGLMVVNLHAEEPACSELVERIGASFDGALHAVTTADHGNRIVFAAEASVMQQCGSTIRQRWAALAEVHRRTLRVGAGRIARALQWPELPQA